MKKRKPESVDWEKVFKLRCRSKRGCDLTVEEMLYCHAAIEEDMKRYASMDKDVWNATAPFGGRLWE